MVGNVQHEGRPKGLEITDTIFRLLVSQVKDYAIFLLDRDGKVSTWNAGAEALKGYRADEIIGRHFSRFYEERDAAMGKPRSLLKKAEQFGRIHDEGWRVRKDGSRFWADVVITALRDEDGNLYGFAKVTRDLTERRRYEEQLEARVAQRTQELSEANEKLRATVEELERFHDLVVGRELRLMDAERELAELKERLSHYEKQGGLDHAL
jgi:PAS domain S-box-containing protein